MRLPQQPTARGSGLHATGDLDLWNAHEAVIVGWRIAAVADGSTRGSYSSGTRSRPEPAVLIIKPFRTETAKAAISQTLFFDVKALRRRRAVASG